MQNKNTILGLIAAAQKINSISPNDNDVVYCKGFQSGQAEAIDMILAQIKKIIWEQEEDF